MKAVCEALGVARSNIAAGLRAPIAKPLKRVGRPPVPEEELVARIKAVIGDQPTYGYRRVWAMLKREGREKGLAPVNAKRVHRVMKAHGMLLQRHAGGADARRHDGKIAVAHSNLRWLVFGRLRTDLRQRRESACRLRPRLLRPGGDGLGRDHARHQRGRCPRPYGRVRRISVRPGQSLAADHRMAQRQRIRLHRQGDQSLRPRPRLQAIDDARHQPAIQRDGRGLCGNHQARLCPRQSNARRQDRHRKLAALVRPLQRRSPAQRSTLPFAARVHRCAIKQGGRVRSSRGNNTFTANSSASNRSTSRSYFRSTVTLQLQLLYAWLRQARKSATKYVLEAAANPSPICRASPVRAAQAALFQIGWISAAAEMLRRSCNLRIMPIERSSLRLKTSAIRARPPISPP